MIRILMLTIILGMMTFDAKHFSPDDLNSYRGLFEKEFGVKVDYPISFFNDENTDHMGECSYMEILGKRFNEKIRINEYYWKTLNDDQKLLLMYHEMGHCSLGLGHNSDIVAKNGCPRSNMHPYNISRRCIRYQGVRFYIDSMKD